MDSDVIKVGENNTGDSTDQDVLFNLGFSTAVGTVIFLVFCWLRVRLWRVYSSNLHSRQQVQQRRPMLKVDDGAFSWLRTTLTLPDERLLSFVGLDSFMFVQVCWLMLGTFVVLTVPMCVILLPLYFFATDGPTKLDSFYMKLSILHCSPHFLWVTLLMCYFTSLLIFYFVYVFYRNYSVLRQAYLRDPSALTSCLSLQRLVAITGSLPAARRIANMHTRATIFTGVSSKYDRDALLALLEASGKKVSSITFINPRDDLVERMAKRNDACKALECAYQDFLKKAFDKVKGDRKRGEVIEELKTLVSGVDPSLLSRLHDTSFHPEFRRKHKKKDGSEVDAIHYWYEKLLHYERETARALDEYLRDDAAGDSATAATLSTDPSPAQRRPSIKTLQEQTTVFSFKKATWLGHNMKDVKLTFYGTSQSAIVLWEEAEAAAATAQTVQSRRPFSLAASKAPAADDVLWDNVQLPSADRNLRHTAGDLFFILAIIFFVPIVSALSSFTDIEKLMRWFPWLERVVGTDQRVRSALQGILAPLVLNIAFAIAPYLLMAIGHYQGRVSKTDIQYSLVRKYSIFLFVQSFVVAVVTQTIVDTINDILGRRWEPILKGLRETFPSKSSFFFNMLLQKAFISMPLHLIKPMPLLYGLMSRASSFSASPRSLYEWSRPDEFDLGIEYPQYVVFLVQIILAFMSITPLTVLGGVLYFALAYTTFRHCALYNYQVKHESGGIFWKRIAQQLVLGVFLNQAFTLLHFTMRGAAAEAVLMVPLLVCTWFYSKFLGKTFEQRMDYLPQTREDELAVDTLLTTLREHQDAMLDIDNGEAGGRPDEPQQHDEKRDQVAYFIPIADLARLDLPPSEQHAERGKQRANTDYTRISLDNPYSNPVLFRRIPSLALHPLLLPVLRKLVGGGDENAGNRPVDVE